MPKYSGGAEVIFSVTVDRRQVVVTDVGRMTGPTMATVPVRIAFGLSQMIDELLLRQAQVQ